MMNADLASQPGRSRPPRVIAMAMQKGGTGKTTSTVCLARAIANLNLRVLAVDLDPQGNLTDALSKDALPRGQVSIADAILPEGAVPDSNRTALSEVLVDTIWPGVDLAPVTSTETMARAEMLIQASSHGREMRLRDALEPVSSHYDAVLIDNAPSLGLLLANALAAGDDERVLVVMEADRWSTSGLVQLRSTIDRARRYTNRTLDWGGVIISKWRGTRDERDKLADIAEHFPDADVWASPQDTSKTIPLWVGIKQDINQGIALDESANTARRVLAGTYTWCAQQLLAAKETYE